MKQTLKILLFTCILQASFSTLGAEEESPVAPVLMTQYHNNTSNYSVQYPSNWYKKSVEKLDLFISAPLKKEEQQAPATLNITSEPVPSEVNLAQFYTESVKSLTNELKNVKVESTGDRTFGDIRAKWILYTHEMQLLSYKVLQIFLVNQSYLYLITASAPAEDFDAYKPEFESIISTFKFETLKPSIEF